MHQVRGLQQVRQTAARPRSGRRRHAQDAAAHRSASCNVIRGSAGSGEHEQWPSCAETGLGVVNGDFPAIDDAEGTPPTMAPATADSQGDSSPHSSPGTRTMCVWCASSSAPCGAPDESWPAIVPTAATPTNGESSLVIGMRKPDGSHESGFGAAVDDHGFPLVQRRNDMTTKQAGDIALDVRRHAIRPADNTHSSKCRTRSVARSTVANMFRRDHEVELRARIAGRIPGIGTRWNLVRLALGTCAETCPV